MITLTIDNTQITVNKETSILEAARKANINIPTLCHIEGMEGFGACRLCVVEIAGEPLLALSCSRKVSNGMQVKTNTERIRKSRRMIIELLLANHNAYCPTCERSQHCDLQKLAFDLGVKNVRFKIERESLKLDESSMAIIRDPNKCILCGKCVRICHQVQTVNVINFFNRGTDLTISTAMDKGLGNVECVGCGQCIHVCPSGAIKERSSIDKIWAEISNPDKHVVVQEAPSIRAALGEDLGVPTGSLVTGKMHAALKKLGFDAVFDTNFTADLTIIEEGNELVKRIKEGGTLPMITSCCPGWIKFAEHFYPDLLPHLSTCKSPQQMFGALAKTYYPQKAGIDPAKVVSVSMMPCTAKKFEAQRPEMEDSGFRDVDYVLTTRELSKMIKEAGLDFANLQEEKAEELLGAYSGAATIFGATGGVMEAALRTAYKLITGNELTDVDIFPVRGLEGIKETSITLNSMEVRLAVAHGLGNARTLLEQIRSKTSPYHFIEIMACPGGCVGGGGQPYGFDMKTREIRGQALYNEDRVLIHRKSHENSEVSRLYQEYLCEPLGEKSHKLLHTHYTLRSLV